MLWRCQVSATDSAQPPREERPHTAMRSGAWEHGVRPHRCAAQARAWQGLRRRAASDATWTECEPSPERGAASPGEPLCASWPYPCGGPVLCRPPPRAAARRRARARTCRRRNLRSVLRTRAGAATWSVRMARPRWDTRQSQGRRRAAARTATAVPAARSAAPASRGAPRHWPSTEVCSRRCADAPLRRPEGAPAEGSLPETVCVSDAPVRPPACACAQASGVGGRTRRTR